MWSRLNALGLLCYMLSLAACGFQPMYGDQTLSGGNTPMRGNVAITPMGGHEGQLFKADLEDLFNPEGLNTKAAQYQLTVSLTKALVPAVVKSDGTIQRYEVRFESDFKLFKTGSPTPVFIGKLHRYGSYNVAVNANFATYEAGQDVIERILKEMAEDYVLRISGYLAGLPAEKPTP